MTGPRAQIVGLGAATPVGRTVWASAAAVRAGVCGFSEHPFMLDTVAEPMRIARAPWLPASLEMVERCSQLLLPAIAGALAPTHNRARFADARLGLALALPPPRPGSPSEFGRMIFRALSQRYGRQLCATAVFELGHAAGHAALDAAVRSVDDATADAYIVAGVDSYLAPDTLDWLETCDQLNGAGPLNNAWGFIPGEAGGALLIANDRFAEKLDMPVFGEIVGVGLGRETNLIKTDSVCIGAGLTQAFRQALAALPSHEQIHNIFCDLNGEPYRADEYGFTALRVKQRFRAVTDFVAPADCWGDIGAAGVPLHVALGVLAHRKGYATGPLSMVCASSETGERGAAVIRALGVEGH